MHRFRLGYIGDDDEIVLDDPSQVHRLRDVLRLAKGDDITVFDGEGRECVCTIDRIDRSAVMLRVESARQVPSPKARLVVACALPKKGMDEVVDKLTQLGVDTIIPMRTARVVVRLREEPARSRVERWRRLAQAAAEQSRRGDVPEISQLTDVGQVIAQADGFDLKLIPTLSGERTMLGHIVGDASPDSIFVMVGPEGDFTDEELSLAAKAGFVAVSLGDQVLRVDTAAIAVAGYLRLSGIV